MSKTLYTFLFMTLILFSSACKQGSIGPINGILVVYSPALSSFIDAGGLDGIHLIVDTVDPEEVFSFSYAEMDEFRGTLKARRVILLLLEQSETQHVPKGLTEGLNGVYTGRDVWATDQQVFAVVMDSSSTDLPSELPGMLETAYDNQMHDYIYESFVSTSMTSPERMDSLAAFGFTLNVPKSFQVRIWSPDDGFVQYQRQPDEECLLLFSVRALVTNAELTDSNAVLAREAMARLYFYDASADSVDRARVTVSPISQNGLSGWELTGVWRNPDYLNAGSFTTRVFDHQGKWYILDMEVYNPGFRKEPYLREGWIIMDTFRKE